MEKVNIICEFTRVSKTYGKKTVLEDVSFSVRENESIGLFGPNGSGKTTLLKIASLLEFPAQGHFWLSDCACSKVGASLDDYKFLKNLSAEANLKNFFNSVMPAIEQGEQFYERLNQYKKDLCIEENMSKKFKHLSTGTKKKLDLLSVFGKNNILYLLDEPTNALEAQSVSYLETIINQKRKAGCAFIIASHEKSFLKNCCDRIYEIERGKILSNHSSF
jgi:ABC-type multidrug transport system ATPase subunit